MQLVGGGGGGSLALWWWCGGGDLLETLPAILQKSRAPEVNSVCVVQESHFPVNILAQALGGTAAVVFGAMDAFCALLDVVGETTACDFACFILGPIEALLAPMAHQNDAAVVLGWSVVLHVGGVRSNAMGLIEVFESCFCCAEGAIQKLM